MDPAAALGRFLHFRPQHGLLLHVGGVLETVHDTTDQNPSRELENTELLNWMLLKMGDRLLQVIFLFVFRSINHPERSSIPILVETPI